MKVLANQIFLSVSYTIAVLSSIQCRASKRASYQAVGVIEMPFHMICVGAAVAALLCKAVHNAAAAHKCDLTDLKQSNYSLRSVNCMNLSE